MNAPGKSPFSVADQELVPPRPLVAFRNNPAISITIDKLDGSSEVWTYVREPDEDDVPDTLELARAMLRAVAGTDWHAHKSCVYSSLMNERACCQHCDHEVEWSHKTELGFGGFVHLQTGTTVCPTNTPDDKDND